jgi:hypothetical protein
MANQIPPPPPPLPRRTPLSEEEIQSLMRIAYEKDKIKNNGFKAFSFNRNNASIIGLIAGVVFIINGQLVKPESSIHQIYQVLNLGFGFSLLVMSEIAENTSSNRRRDQ